MLAAGHLSHDLASRPCDEAAAVESDAAGGLFSPLWELLLTHPVGLQSLASADADPVLGDEHSLQLQTPQIMFNQALLHTGCFACARTHKRTVGCG